MADVIDANLVVFCVTKSSTLSEEEILKTCVTWLPAFMVPNDVHIMPTLPYLASGKVDRKALQAKHKARQGLSVVGDDWSTNQEAQYVVCDQSQEYDC